MTDVVSDSELAQFTERGYLGPYALLPEATALAILVPAAYAINNTLSAFGSGVFDRYQARVTWLFAFAAVLIIIELVESEKTGSHIGGSST